MKKLTSNINGNKTITIIDGRVYLTEVKDNLVLEPIKRLFSLEAIVNSFELTCLVQEHCVDLYHVKGNKVFKARYYPSKDALTIFKLEYTVPTILDKVVSISNTISIYNNGKLEKRWCRGYFNSLFKRGEELNIEV